MSKSKTYKFLRNLRSKSSSNIPVKFIEEHLEGELSPHNASPPVKFSTESDLFVTADTQVMTARYFLLVLKTSDAD